MTRRICFLAMFLMLLANQPAADTYCHSDWLYLEAAVPQALCSVDVEPFSPVDVHIYLNSYSQRDITELSFAITNLHLPDVLVTYVWEAQEVIGDPETGLTLIFDPPLDADLSPHHLGTMTILSIAEDWPGSDYHVDIVTETTIDVHQQAMRLRSNWFVLNCGDPYDCCCVGCGTYGPWILASEFMPASGDVVGENFTFSFRADGWHCNGGVIPNDPRAYTGSVLVEGIPVEDFEGFGTQYYSFDLDAGAVPPGEYVHVEVAMEHESGQTQSAQLEYLISESTGVPPSRPMDFSALKALYR
jgi:hypothetical protein